VLCLSSSSCGFQTLTDDIDIHYMMSMFTPLDAAGGYSCDDAAFGIA
jgi:hypothetical protein